MNTITINGVTIQGGRNVRIQNGRVIVDGKDITPDAKHINIMVHGNVERLEADSCEKIGIAGSAGSISTQSGEVIVNGDVNGSVNTMSGNVECGGKIAGSVQTMSGNVRHR